MTSCSGIIEKYCGKLKIFVLSRLQYMNDGEVKIMSKFNSTWTSKLKAAKVVAQRCLKHVIWVCESWDRGSRSPPNIDFCPALTIMRESIRNEFFFQSEWNLRLTQVYPSCVEPRRRGQRQVNSSEVFEVKCDELFDATAKLMWQLMKQERERKKVSFSMFQLYVSLQQLEDEEPKQSERKTLG